jgi:hypothetical protein
VSEDPQGESTAEPLSEAKISRDGASRVGGKGHVFTGLVFLLAVALYAALLALAATGVLEAGAFINQGSAQVGLYLAAPAFYVPIIAFAVLFFVLVFVVSSKWRSKYVGGGLIIAVLVYFSAIGGALFTVSAWTLTSFQFKTFFVQLATNPLIIAAAIVAREIPLWFGVWRRARECPNSGRKGAAHEGSRYKDSEYEDTRHETAQHEGSEHEGPGGNSHGAPSQSSVPSAVGAPRAAHALSPTDAAPSSPAGSPPPTTPPVNSD